MIMKKIRLFVIPSNLKSDNVVVFYYGRGVELGAYAPNFSPATPFAQQGMLFYFSFCRPAYPMKNPWLRLRLFHGHAPKRK